MIKLIALVLIAGFASADDDTKERSDEKPEPAGVTPTVPVPTEVQGSDPGRAEDQAGTAPAVDAAPKK